MVTYDPSYKTAPITQYGNPTQVLEAFTNFSKATAQQFWNGAGFAWMTQRQDGSAAGLDTLIITKLEGTSTSSTHNDEIDHMRIFDGGHGLGLWIEKDSSGQLWVWTSLRGQNQVNAPRGGILSRFKYTKGDWNLSKIPGGIQFMKQFPNAYGELSEEIYNCDLANDFVVSRQFDFHTGNQELYTRRKLSDVKAGVDRPYGRFNVPVNPPTMQGFTTCNDTLFRWNGISNGAPNGSPNQVVAGDPIALEQWDWNTGQMVGRKEFPSLGTPWRDGQYEPEGCSIYRHADGTASLLVGLVDGGASGHTYPAYKFANIGAAV